MTDQRHELPPPEHGVSLVGPFIRREPYILVVDGYRVPHVEFFKEPDGTFSATVDGRMSVLELTEPEIKKWGYVLANAMAVSAGLSCFGENAQPMPFAPRMMGITAARLDGEPKPKLELVRDERRSP